MGVKFETIPRESDLPKTSDLKSKFGPGNVTGKGLQNSADGDRKLPCTLQAGDGRVGNDGMTGEEKLRLRREKLERWRRERAQKQVQYSSPGPPESPSNMIAADQARSSVPKESTGVSSQRFGLSLKLIPKIPSNSLMRKTLKDFNEDAISPLDNDRRKIIKTGSFETSRAAQVSLSPKTQGDDPEEPHHRRSVEPPRGSKSALKIEEEDPLEKYMHDVDTEFQRIISNNVGINDEGALTSNHNNANSGGTQERGPDANGVLMDEEDEQDEQKFAAEDLIEMARKRAASKRKDLAPVDHSLIEYEPFRKDFYIEPPALANMTNDEVNRRRLELDGIRVRGHKCPKPIEKWTHLGLPIGAAEVVKSVLKYEKPTPIQAQTIPAIMNGRDVIGIAKTGSGKTIAFLLPMFRHIKDQRPLGPQEGPISLIMTPTRELAVQIHKECKHFVKVMGMRSVCCYGGSHIKEQIAELKRSADILIGTPGRIIDLLCANNGRVTNLRRVTYLVIDEADRMFDMGFEPQVMRIVSNIRPDRQNVLFSATFPRKMEALARKILNRPLEITVGGRSVVAADIDQIVEVRPSDTKFLRLLEILGKTFVDDPESKVLIFVDRQEAADMLLSNLFQRGYPCQSLHGGKDQADRDSTISDFKNGNVNVLIATSVAARGLDVKHLKVVINYDCPNHMEDYVHRVGRTGRAGTKGTAYTFVTPSQDKYAVDTAKALTASGNPVPEELQALCDQFIAKVKAGTASFSSSGFGGKGLEKLEHERDIVKMIQKKVYSAPYADDDDDDGGTLPTTLSLDGDAKNVNSSGAYGCQVWDEPSQKGPFVTDPKKALAAVANTAKAKGDSDQKQTSSSASSGVSKAREIISEINARLKDSISATTQPSTLGTSTLAYLPIAPDEKKQGSDSAFSYEIEINDYPQKARWRVTNKEQISQITEISGAAITTRGTFFGPGRLPGPGERKLYLFIEGDNQLVIDKAKAEIKRILTEATIATIESEGSGSRYHVV